MTEPGLGSLDVGGHVISYLDHGPRHAPVVLLMSGWCHDHRLFDQLVPLLRAHYRTLCVDWRGHGADRGPVPDFGCPEQAADTLAVLDALGIERFLPVSHSHGGWANLLIADRAGTARVPRLILLDWLMTPPAPGFADSLAAIQNPDTWVEGRRRLFDVWLNGQDQPRVRRHLDEEMSGFGYPMWALSCRVIADAYAEFGSPLNRMAAMAEPRTVKHLFSQPTDPAYERAQHEFGRHHPWFDYRMLGGPTHFPSLDSPARVAAEIAEYAEPLPG
ncbi:alpha/beta fold hydrolase [Pseudonocardia acaciae]|uniref:alpha/beta fold hydrolase n=1 Tax=Pseudonocardia acaciae TaxID=551276 RepID=UPI000685E743|nr:alpha/beta hydrolase [Pseudonocardia acaciae]